MFLSSSIRWNYWNIFNNKQFSLTWMEKFLILLGIDRGGRNYLVSERKKNKGNNKRKGISFWLRESIEKLFLNLWKIGTRNIVVDVWEFLFRFNAWTRSKNFNFIFFYFFFCRRKTKRNGNNTPVPLIFFARIVFYRSKYKCS